MSSPKLNSYFSAVQGTVWSPVRIDCELAELQRATFFRILNHSLVAGSLQLVGIIRFIQEETSKVYSMKIRLVYPSEYPWAVPMVFDEEKRFEPSAGGHQFRDGRLCLSFPRNDEFAVGSEKLSLEVLTASLVWLDKRFVFERTGQWPGDAEEHGWAGPLRRLLREEVVRCGNPYLGAWAAWIIADLVVPYGELGCPCLSGKPFVHCHRRVLLLALEYLVHSRYEREAYDHRTTFKAA